MQKKVQKILLQQQMVLPKETVLVGVSGGADSVCLLLLLSALAKEMDITVEAVHVEHGIRGEESLSDADFVKDLCEQMEVPCHRISVDVPKYSLEKGIGMEESARILRYEAFVRLAIEKRAKVALAHHMEDNAETILFQMLRGSSLTGLCGMQFMRTDEHGVTYIRPLLQIHRKEIEDFLYAHGMNYCVDSTNAELAYSRNFIRAVILPEMQKVNAQAVTHINHTAEHLWDIHNFLEEETEKAWKTVVEIKESCGKNSNQSIPVHFGEVGREVHRGGNLDSQDEKKILLLDTEKLAIFHIAIQKELVYKVISYMLGAKKDISAFHVQAVLELCRNQSGREIHLPNDVIAKKEYQTIRFFRKEYKKSEDKSLKNGEDNTVVISDDLLEKWKESGETVEICLGTQGEKLQISIFSISHAYDQDSKYIGNFVFKDREFQGKITEIPRKRYTKWMDYDKIKSGFCIRTRQSGDVFITDTLGHRKKLNRYLIDEKIPTADRDSLWLLTQTHTVLWLIGGRISEHVKVTEDTKTIIAFTYATGGK